MIKKLFLLLLLFTSFLAFSQEKFTLSELQKVYEAILGEKLHRGTFQRKILGLGILQRHEKQFSGKAHKAPFLYSFGQ